MIIRRMQLKSHTSMRNIHVYHVMQVQFSLIAMELLFYQWYSAHGLSLVKLYIVKKLEYIIPGPVTFLFFFFFSK